MSQFFDFCDMSSGFAAFDGGWQRYFCPKIVFKKIFLLRWSCLLYPDSRGDAPG